MSSPAPPEENHNCPINCPNRQPKGRQPVLGGGYIFALIVALILAFESLDASYKRVQGVEDIVLATKSPPSYILVIGLTLIGLGLGIEIDKSVFFSNSKELIKGMIASSLSEESTKNQGQ